MRAIGLDFGAATVGVAVTDALFLTAQRVETIRRDKESHLRPTLRRIGELITLYEAEILVVGLPLNMDDSIGERAEKSMAFAELLKKRFGLPVFLQDERLSSFQAEEEMREAGIRPEHFSRYVDQIAAQIILEDWMREHGTGNDSLSDR